MLVTLRGHEQAVQMLKRFGIYHYFSAIQGATDEFAAYDNYAHSKAAMLEKMLQTLHPQDTDLLWMIGDTEADVLSAKEHGIASIALSCGMRSQAYLQRLEPNYILGNLSVAAELVVDQITSHQL